MHNESSVNSSEESPARPARHVLIGTAGHIDHGKTRLVAALTGVDTDRLPEEKTRGISIDLGFASWTEDEVLFGVVDVPGHERFLRNMAAGATGINVALLVVAADDGVMPQTREHLDVLHLLGVSQGVVAVTKCDLVEADAVQAARDEVQDLIRNTCFAGAAVVPVSAATGAGLLQLRAELVAAARRLPPAPSGLPFRMPVDRVFSLGGIGTVVTGSVLCGTVVAGETLELVPSQTPVRVRGIQNHDHDVERSSGGQRTAINIPGIDTTEVTRGDELAAPGFIQPSRRLIVRLTHLPSSPMLLKDRTELSLHLGTRETACRVILRQPQLAAGAMSFAELRTREPVAAAHGQRFILRRPSPSLTIGGGIVIDPGLPTGRRLPDAAAFAEKAAATCPLDRLSHLLSQSDTAAVASLEAAWRAAIPPADFPQLLAELQQRGELVSLSLGSGAALVHRHRLQQHQEVLLRELHRELARQSPRSSLSKLQAAAVVSKRLPREWAVALIERLLKENRLTIDAQGNVAPAGLRIQLTKNQSRTIERMLSLIRAAGLMPPMLKALAAELGQSETQLRPLIRLCLEASQLIEVAPELYFAPQPLDHARELCRNYLDRHSTATVSQLREAWGISRKYAFPLCEWFDGRGYTIREGDLRRAGPELHAPLRNGGD